MAEEFKLGYSFKDDRLNELKQLFPEAFEDGKFNVDTLKELIGDYSSDSNASEYFGLNWLGKRDARRIASKLPSGTLNPINGEGINEENTQNIFIEGDNLEVLKILRKSYSERVKVIYIDPPYNTGNDFIYKDDFSDSTEDYLKKSGDQSEEGLLVSNPKTTGRFHSNWLTFIYPRIRLAKDLLTPEGVIYISIDDNEYDNLKKVCDEIFGEENYRGSIIRGTGTRMGSGNKKISSEIDLVLVYSKTPKFSFSALPMSEDDLKIYDLEDENGKYLIRSLRRTGGENRREDRPSMFYPVISPDGTEILPLAPEGWESRWVCGKDTYEELLDQNMIEWKKVKKQGTEKWQVYQKHYLGDAVKFASNLWNDIDGNKKATKEVNALFDGNKFFDHPKPVDFLKRILEISNLTEGDIVLDFFAGSGSTAEAVMGLSKYSFLLVQLPEPTDPKSVAYKNSYLKISEITKKRLLNAITIKYPDQGFKCFSQSSSTIYRWQDFDPEKGEGIAAFKTQMELAFKNPVQDGTSVDDFVTEILLNEGFPLTASKEDLGNGIYKVSHEWVPYALFITMTDALSKEHIEALEIDEKDHFVCLDKAFQQNNSLKQTLDNQCKLFTI